MPQIKKTFSNSTNTFAPNLKKKNPQFFFKLSFKKNLPPIKDFAPISLKFVNPKWD